MDKEYNDEDRQELVQRARSLSTAHWAWLSKVMEMMYKDAMTHGYIHGWEDRGKEEENDK